MPNAATLVITDSNGIKLVDLQFTDEKVNHEVALDKLLAILRQKFPRLNIAYAGHRIVLGGERYTRAIKLDNDSLDYLESLSKIEPTHQYYEVMGARALVKIFQKLSKVLHLIPHFIELCQRSRNFTLFHLRLQLKVCVIGAFTEFRMLISAKFWHKKFQQHSE
jgi:acetate kinase